MQNPLPLDGGETPGPLFAPGVAKKQARNRCRGKARIRAMKQATPPWAKKKAIRGLYQDARGLSKSTGIPHTVDHIIPLHHPRVCGLHVETNLRIMTEADNRAKGNNWNPEQTEMFDELRLPLQQVQNEEHVRQEHLGVQDPQEVS
jgi:5-methylcytosine-specific restriction endonuclease McrA